MLLSVENIKKSFGERTILQSISFGLQQHHTLGILGKSGCGKSTLLKIIAGLEAADSGTVALQEKPINALAAHLRGVIYLFQEPLLFPHLNVSENIAFGLKVRKLPTSDIKNKLAQTLLNLELEAHAKKMPHQISGGQKQRVAFGRALILNPPLLLLDEPFSSLDVETRANMQALYKRIAAEYDITALFVTHDLKEALTMGDQIAYMENGILEVYPSKTAFINDEKTGVRGERDFWSNL